WTPNTASDSLIATDLPCPEVPTKAVAKFRLASVPMIPGRTTLLGTSARTLANTAANRPSGEAIRDRAISCILVRTEVCSKKDEVHHGGRSTGWSAAFSRTLWVHFPRQEGLRAMFSGNRSLKYDRASSSVSRVHGAVASLAKAHTKSRVNASQPRPRSSR